MNRTTAQEYWDLIEAMAESVAAFQIMRSTQIVVTTPHALSFVEAGENSCRGLGAALMAHLERAAPEFYKEKIEETVRMVLDSGLGGELFLTNTKAPTEEN